MPGIETIEQLKELLEEQGVRTAWIKHLSPKQDNEKNQIYLGGGLDGVTNIFPATIHARSPSESTTKRRSKTGKPKLEARLDFAWLSPDGNRHDAPGTTIIDYFQYPEVRMSGFLKGCDDPPDALRRDHQAQYGRRILVMGTARDGKVVGLVLTEQNDPLVANFPDLPLAGGRGVLHILSIDGEAGKNPAELIRQEIEAIVSGGWYSSRIKKGDTIEPFKGSQGGGYTLEALLGVAANGDKKPDKHGYEIKGYSGSRISLMTPVPDYGHQGLHTFREFMEQYGLPGQKGDGSLRFTGLYRSGKPNAKTGFVLRVAGYDRVKDSFGDIDDIGVELFDPGKGAVVAGWSVEKMANCWNAKHANALYLKFENRDGREGVKDYRYASDWVTGSGTDVWKLLRAIDSGLVFHDPAHTIYSDGKAKVRPQWRINARDLPEAMRVLYSSSEMHTVSSPPTDNLDALPSRNSEQRESTASKGNLSFPFI
ncbi:MvaI/BcnI family restriction endonuclease [Parasphingorhabdus sp.]|uniref:MvaI/BcnI family restriction endonuclease n=1 Tax=Parasphingorhabdus sp. TaxID=2709688 RepID=UPI0035932EFE